jgi:hypothetical protein
MRCYLLQNLPQQEEADGLDQDAIGLALFPASVYETETSSGTGFRMELATGEK